MGAVIQSWLLAATVEQSFSYNWSSFKAKEKKEKVS